MIIEHASLTRAPLGSQQREGIINSLSLRVRVVAMDARYLAIGEEGSFLKMGLLSSPDPKWRSRGNYNQAT
jgi:hypothetical protein